MLVIHQGLQQAVADFLSRQAAQRQESVLDAFQTEGLARGIAAVGQAVGEEEQGRTLVEADAANVERNVVPEAEAIPGL